MYRAKQGGGDADGDHVAFYSQDMNQGMQERMRIESGLRHALGNGHCCCTTTQVLHRQRQDHRRRSAVRAAPRARPGAPIEFIPWPKPPAGVQVGEWVLEAACAQAQQWKQAGCRRSGSPSTSPRANSPPRCPAGARNAGPLRLGAELAELEITESTLMHNIDRVIGIMDRITALGVTLSLDDFGTATPAFVFETLPHRHAEDRPLLHHRHPATPTTAPSPHHHQHRPAAQAQHAPKATVEQLPS
ncbi:hypothetical protein ACFOLJ_00005 [Rugamonas sp. CCM 8940]